jgi:hypothetical protein
MNQERETLKEKAGKGKKGGLFQGIMEKMMVRMMKLCPCSGMMETLKGIQSEGGDCAEMMTEAEEGGFCAKMMATCCDAQVDSPKESQGA